MNGLLLILPTLVLGVQSECISNLKVSNFSATKISLSWDYDCDESNVDIYKVDYVHNHFKACTDKLKDNDRPSGFGNIEVSQSEAVIDNLHPYSDYTLTVRVITKRRAGRPETASITGSTDWSIPVVRAKHSSVDYSYKNTATSLWFNWSPPSSKSECSLYRSKLGSFVYVVKGLSAWNTDFVYEDFVDISESLVQVSGLKPHSDYIFFLYISNDAGEYDEDVYLKLEGRTLPAVPQPPHQLAATPLRQDSLHLRWAPSLPPTGVVSHYIIRWKYSSEKDWLGEENVAPSDSLCNTDDMEINHVACFTLTGLQSENYTIQARAFNQDIEKPSDWSTAVHVRLRTEEPGSISLSYIFIIAIILLLLGAGSGFLIYRFFTKRSKSGFDKVPVFPPSQPPPIIRPGTGPPLAVASSPFNEYVLGGKSRSIQDPLPALPGQENIYAEPIPRTKIPLDEDDYLKPNPVRVESRESLDDQGYLRPNFHRFQRMDTSGSDKELLPSNIPPVSYLSGPS